MFRLFSAGLIANLLYVVSGALKQYFIAAQLPVSSVGIYGTWVAQASLLLVLIPFPSYLNVLIKGFSAAPDDHATREGLIAEVVRELKYLAFAMGGILTCALVINIAIGKASHTLAALVLLLTAQYVALTADILLRMRQSHGRFALFMATRNLPSLLVIIVFGLRSPIAVVIAELIGAILIGGFVYSSRSLRVENPRLPALQSFNKEQATLWMARLGQYVNTSLLRLLVPFLYGANDTGLFFFACIAQIPCALFLSVTTQLFGHALARMKQGDYRDFARIQVWFFAPNAVYIVAVAMLLPYWPALTTHVPKLIQYQGVGRLILAVSLYSAVLSSDCTEYLLRSRGMSNILLRYNLSSVSIQIVCLGIGAGAKLSIESTIMVCAVAAAVVLMTFSAFTFRRVLKMPAAVQSG
jgi:hypothetical protein